ncbi:MAG: hypothetical protein Kow00120_30000 [Anaerolineae bacterium]
MQNRGCLAFATTLLQGFGRPTWPLLGVYAAGIIAVAILGNLVYDLALSPMALPAEAVGRTLALSAVLIVVAAVLYRVHLRLQRVAVVINDVSDVPPHAGIVLILGPGRAEPLMWTMEHHISTLRYAWVLLSAHNEALEATLEELRQAVAARGWAVAIKEALLPEPSVRCAYEAVRAIYAERAPEVGMAPHDVIADITGGLKPLTAGMVLACTEFGWPMSYVLGKYAPDGTLIPGERKYVGLNVDFVKPRS